MEYLGMGIYGEGLVGRLKRGETGCVRVQSKDGEGRRGGNLRKGR